jgi:hypothetical protein
MEEAGEQDIERGENLKVVLAKFSALSLAVLVSIAWLACVTHMASSRVEYFRRVKSSLSTTVRQRWTF